MRFFSSLPLALTLLAPAAARAQDLRWTPVSGSLAEPYAPCLAALAWAPDGTWLAGSREGLYRAASADTAWTDVLDGGLAHVGVTALATLPDGVALASTNDGLYRSADAGRTWAPVAGAPHAYLEGVVAAGGSAWVVTPDVRVFRSEDGGVTWAQVADLDQGVYRFSALPSGTLLLKRWADFVRSEDGGATWTDVPGFAPSSAVVPGPGGAAYAAGPGGDVYRSDDDGATWTLAADLGGSSWTLAASPTGTLYFGTNTSADTATSRVLVSSDGVTWAPVYTTPGYRPACAMMPPPAPGVPGLLSLSGGAGVLRAQGDGWTPMNGGFQRLPPMVSLAPLGDALLGFGPGQERYRTTDRGLTWEVGEMAGFPGYADPVLALADGRLFAAGGDLFGSADGGATWAPVFDADGEAVSSLLETTDGPLVAGTSYGAIGLLGRIYRSADGGATWTQAAHPDAWGHVRRFVQAPDGALYALHVAGFEGGTEGIVRSLDDGLTWAPVYTGDVSALAALADGTLLTVEQGEEGYRGVRSMDGGTTWETVGPAPAPVYGLYTFGRLVLASVPTTAGSLYASTDGGATWVAATDGMGRADVLGVVRDGDGYLYVTTGDAGVFRTLDPVTVATAAAPPPARPALEPVRPNPVAGAAALAFSLDAPGEVRLTVVDVLGRQVAVVAQGAYLAGRHTAAWAPTLAPGVYTAVLRTGGRTTTARFTVAR